MRDILFRGKRIDNREWVYGGYFRNNTFEEHVIQSDAQRRCYNVDPETVGQYTGLKDDSGAKIFEGDILSLNQYGLVIVVYQDGCFGVNDGGVFSPLLPSLWGMGGKIAGNIYDNPNLIAEGK